MKCNEILVKNQYGLLAILCLLIVILGIQIKLATGLNTAKQTTPSSPTNISLYPGFITKNNGQIFWHSQKPVFDEDNKQWINLKAVDITNCINDPWPAESGGEKLILEVRNYEK